MLLAQRYFATPFLAIFLPSANQDSVSVVLRSWGGSGDSMFAKQLFLEFQKLGKLRMSQISARFIYTFA